MNIKIKIKIDYKNVKTVSLGSIDERYVFEGFHRWFAFQKREQ